MIADLPIEFLPMDACMKDQGVF
jgi:carotenoid cleavage dioxygenase-like enzyme